VGDERSFEHLYRRHRAEVYRALLRELGNREDAEDVTQAAFLDAYRALARGNEPERPRAWLFTIAQNARRRRFQRLRRAPEQAELEREPAADEVAVTVRELREALELLPANQRATLVLREIGGFSYAEIARRLDLSVAAVQMLLFRARRTLRSELGGEATRPRTGALPWPPWLGELSSTHGQAGLASRAAGVAAAGALGAAVVVGAGSLPGARPDAEPRPLQRHFDAPASARGAAPEPPPPARPGRQTQAPAKSPGAAPPPRRTAVSRQSRTATSRPSASQPPSPRPPAAPLPPRVPVEPPLPAQPPLLPLPAPVIPEIAAPVVPPLLPPDLAGAAGAVPELPESTTPATPALPPIAVPPVPAPPAGTGDQGGGALTGFPTS
jgi:RNA polymerase sigma-70 factor (ECF subfamily)